MSPEETLRSCHHPHPNRTLGAASTHPNRTLAPRGQRLGLGTVHLQGMELPRFFQAPPEPVPSPEGGHRADSVPPSAFPGPPACPQALFCLLGQPPACLISRGLWNTPHDASLPHPCLPCPSLSSKATGNPTSPMRCPWGAHPNPSSTAIPEHSRTVADTTAPVSL